MKCKKLLASTMVTALVLAGCGGKGSSDKPDTADKIVTSISKPVDITFWHAMMGDQEKALKSLTDEFMKENKNIKVTLQNQSSYPDLQQKLTATMASPKNLPTMTQAYPGWLLDPIQSGKVVNLTPYIENETLKFDNYEDVLPSLRSDALINGKTYGLPFNKSTEVLWYNKSLFKELNLQVPKTWDELASVSKTIYEKKGIPGAGFDSLATFYTTYLKSEGKDLDKNLDVTGPESLKAVQYYLDGIKGGYFRTAGTDHYLSGPFANQRVAMYVGSQAGEAFIKKGVDNKFEIGAARYPTTTSIQQGTDLYVFSSATPEQKTAAYMYMKFLTTKDSQVTWAIQSGYMPIRKSAIDSPKYKDSGSLIAPILADATKNMYSMKNVKGADAAFKEANTVMEGILADKNSDVKKAMEQYKKTIQSMW